MKLKIEEIESIFGVDNLTYDLNEVAVAENATTTLFSKDYDKSGKIGLTPPAYKLDVKPTPKFKVGDIVRLTDRYEETWLKVTSYNPEVGTYILDNSYIYKESDLQSHEEYERELDAKEEPQNTENMEEKELNLLEILKGCEGMEIYSPFFGEVSIHRVSTDLISVYEGGFTFNNNGQWSRGNGSSCSLFPSRDLWLKYPTEPKRAWDEWLEKRKPKYEIKAIIEYCEIGDNPQIYTSSHNIIVNSKDDAQQAADLIRETLGYTLAHILG